MLVLGENDASDRKRIATAAIAAAFIFIVSSLVFMNSTYDQVKAEILASNLNQKTLLLLLHHTLYVQTGHDTKNIRPLTLHLTSLAGCLHWSKPKLCCSLG